MGRLKSLSHRGWRLAGHEEEPVRRSAHPSNGWQHGACEERDFLEFHN